MIKKKKILIITTLNIWNFIRNAEVNNNAGNQTLFNTLKGYADNGYQVKVLTFSNTEKKVIRPFDNVIVKRAISTNLFSFLQKIKKQLKRNTTIENEQLEKEFKVKHRKGHKQMYTFWNIFGFLEGFYECLLFRPNILYGYEYVSTRPAKRLAKFFGLPIMSRFQGTELGFFLDDEKAFYDAKYIIKGTEVQTDLVIMGNDGTAGDIVLKKLGINEKSIRFWVNGLNNKEELLRMERSSDYKQKMGIPEDSFVITTANRFVDWKRIDRIIIAISDLLKSQHNISLILIGGGPEETKLKELVKTLNIVENVHFLGIKSHDETIKHILNTDLYITLNHSGNLGNSILESMALGVPVITLNNGSVSSIIKDMYNGFLVDEGNKENINNKISSLINDKNLLLEIGNNSRQFAKSNLLSWEDRMVLEIEEANKLFNKK